MENLIPVLIVIGGLIYKVYQNYQEEMEKARKRQQQQGQNVPKTPSTEPAQTPVPTHNQRLGRPKPQKLVITPKEERKKEFRQKVEAEKITKQKQLPAEVVRLRQQRSQRQETKRVELEDVEEITTDSNVKAGFDLRQAVIQSVILERPYK